eukprot:scaffold874_cov115-Skeletonema_menzelii.AAC.3
MVAAAAKRRRLPKQCFASICYHYDDLCELLDDKCPFRNTAVFRDMPSDIQALATVKYPRNKTDDTPNFNGITPHVLHLAKMESLERKMENLEANLMNKVTEEMESRGFSSTAFKTSDITAAIAGLVTELKTQISAELSSHEGAIIDEDDWFGDNDEAEGEVAEDSEERRLQRKRKQHQLSADLVKQEAKILDWLPSQQAECFATQLHLLLNDSSHACTLLASG